MTSIAELNTIDGTLSSQGKISWAIGRIQGWFRRLEHKQATPDLNSSMKERRHQAEICALNQQLIKAQEAERMRISGELHDGVLQQITSLTLRLGVVEYQAPPDSKAKTTVSGLQ